MTVTELLLTSNLVAIVFGGGVFYQKLNTIVRQVDKIANDDNTNGTNVKRIHDRLSTIEYEIEKLREFKHKHLNDLKSLEYLALTVTKIEEKLETLKL